MKRLCIILTTVVVFMGSCEKESLESDKVEYSTIDFYGEKLQLSEEITEADVYNYMNYTVTDQTKGLRVDDDSKIDWSKVPSEVFDKILNATLATYPDMSKEIYTDDDLAFVKKGLPELKSKEDAFLYKKHIVVDYLEILIGKEIKNKVRFYLKSQKSLRPSGYFSTIQNSYNLLNPTEQDCASTYPLAANRVNQAKNETFARFGSHNDNTITNARFHGFWSAAMVKEITHLTLNKWKGLDRGKKFATAHEYDTNGVIACTPVQGYTALFNVRSFGLCNYMDLVNNLVGRTYMYNTVGQTWLGNANNIPSYDQIFNHINSLSGTKKNTISEIQGIHPEYTFDNLGNYINAYDYHQPSTILVYTSN